MRKTGKMKFVPAGQIRRIPGLTVDASSRKTDRIRHFTVKRGGCMPVILSDSPGCMTLLAGASTFEVYLEEKRKQIPAVIVETGGEVDNLMFVLQSADLNDSPDAITVSEVITQLIDVHGVTRKQIAESLGKSPAWINKMESLSRKLIESVRNIVSQGHISSRAAQEIARLPREVQMPFAVAAGNAYLSKDKITYLINRYLDEDTSREERDRIIVDPKMALPNEYKSRKGRGIDCSDSARLARAIARCIDSVTYLSRILDRMDPEETALYSSDIAVLADCLSALAVQAKAFLPG